MADPPSFGPDQASETASGLPPIFVWHRQTHQEWGDERLHFWTMHFRPQYHRDKILGVIAQLLDQHHVYSYVIYEVLGFWDLLLRAWVPNTTRDGKRPEETIEHLLRLNLAAHRLWELEGFAVSQMNHSALDALTHEPSDPPPQELLDRVDCYNSWVLSERQEYRGLAQVAVMTAEDAMALRSDLLPLLDRGYIEKLDPDVKGVKFAISIGNPIKPLQPPTRDDLYRQISDLAADIQKRFPLNPTRTNPELSLYAGSGELGTFLLIAKAPDGEFYDFVRALVFGLRETTLSVHHMRPYTHVIAYRRFFAFRDRLVIPNTIDFDSVVDRALTEGVESETLEFKATWRADLGRYLVKDEVLEFPKGTHEIVKAICGLLNTPYGGVLIIGLAELHQLKHLQDKARGEFPVATGEKLVVVGFEFEQRLSNVQFPSWDAYRNSLLQTIDSALDHKPGNLLAVDFRWVENRQVTIVAVRPSRVKWFHVKNSDDKRLEFFVRESGRTVSLQGTATEDYRRANPRGSGR